MRIRQVRKVRRQRRPGYPTRPDVGGDPGFLVRHVPSAWKKSAHMTLALSTLLAGGCASLRGKVATGGLVAVMMAGSLVTGRPAFACIAVTPPAYLSEEDALSVIREELMTVDVELSEGPASIDGIEMPVYRCKVKRDTEIGGGDSLEKEQIGVRPLEVDALDPVRHIAVEFIGVNDEKTVPGVSDKVRAETYSTRMYAKMLSGEINRASGEKLRYRAFYDSQARVRLVDVPRPPGMDKARAERKEAEKAFDRAKAEAVRQESLKQLRVQVKDFIEWLKGQGAI